MTAGMQHRAVGANAASDTFIFQAQLTAEADDMTLSEIRTTAREAFLDEAQARGLLVRHEPTITIDHSGRSVVVVGKVMLDPRISQRGKHITPDVAPESGSADPVEVPA